MRNICKGVSKTLAKVFIGVDLQTSLLCWNQSANTHQVQGLE